LEGYWVDPPGYFDKIVWPEYVRLNEHNATVKDVLTVDTDKNSIDETALMVADKLCQILS
jgi:nicotinamide/nicotinate riboside kinase